MDGSGQQSDENFALLVPTPSPQNARSYKDTKSRLEAYAQWLFDTGRHWGEPDLLEYRRFLLEQRGFAPLTVNAHLSTIRVCYRTLIKDGTIRATLERTLPENLSPSAIEDELAYRILQISREIDPDATQMASKPSKANYLRLSLGDVQSLLKTPNSETMSGIRDRAILGLLAGTGIRAGELCALDVSDLRHEFEDGLALKVRPGTGRTERLVPYGGMQWVLSYVDEWLEAARINKGPVFVGIYKSGRPRETRLTTRALDKILAGYDFKLRGRPVEIHPMDLRRAYARLLYDAGVNPSAIQSNLGLKNSNALLAYIGDFVPSQRVPPDPLSP